MHRQSGAALLILLLALILGGLTWLLQRPATRAAAFSARDKATDRALAEAKEALLGYAAAYPEYTQRGAPPRTAFVPGHLPCPDTGSALGNEGAEAGTCGAKGVTVIGHFPWRSLGIPPPRDGSGECLWYAVSGNYKANPKADLVNPDIPGQFQIYNADGTLEIAGSTPETRPVAVLFAPGPALPGQNRSHQGGECRLDYDARQFLEGRQGIDNSTPDRSAEGLTRLIAGPPGPSFNDRMLWIRREEIFERRIARRPQPQLALFDANYSGNNAPAALTQRVASCLARFGDMNRWNRLPWAAPASLGGSAPDKFTNVNFADRSNLSAGRPPFAVGRSQQVLQSTLGSLGHCPSTNLSHAACRLLRSDNCPEFLAVAGYPTPDDGATHQDSPDGWWEKWKDHLFYVVAPGFTPATQDAADCEQEPGQCLEINGQAYAAALIFAGAPLPGQSRNSSSERMNPENYLEGKNLLAVQGKRNELELAGNDQIACLKGPTATSPGFKLVPNCGNPDCEQESGKLLARIAGHGNLCHTGGSVLPACLQAQAKLAGCACQDAATRFISPPCLDSLNPAACQAAIQSLETCR
ncbi:MAG: hypothetical protein WBH99_04100 [Azovibrio sp.]|uniref:hypothetical protein n=1 Tax=Azovibrio sp. TaxID=1872673 RepID=UPI003C717499